MIQVRSIGASEVQIGRKRITKSTEMVLALAVYFCVRAGERLTRDEVVEVFWPDRDLAKGRHSLRQMLYRLRQKGFTLDGEGEELSLNPSRMDCDATRTLAKDWPETVQASIVEASDEFLPGFSREVSPQFQEWLDSTRNRIAMQYRLAASRQIAQARREGRWVDLERWGRVVLRSDPLNEEATFARAESAAMAGSKAMAFEILDQYVEDLGERSGQIALPAKVLRRRISERRPEWGGRGAQEVRLVGRETLMAQLTEAIESASLGIGGAYQLRGAAGIGKTRLSNDARAFAEFTGFRVTLVRAPSSAARQPLCVALTLIPQLLELRGAAACPPLAMTILRSATAPQHDEALHTPTTTTPAALGWALCKLLEALSEEARLFIQLDDMHHCDAESRSLLSSLATALSSLRIVCISTSRLNQSLDGASSSPASGFITIDVPPLSRDSSAVLAQEFCLSQALVRSEDEYLRLASLSGGNPLFLRELSALRNIDATPASLRKLIRERLAELTTQEMLILRVIGVLGSHATILRVRLLTKSENATLVQLLEQLSYSGIVSLSPTGTLELHESWQTIVFEQLPSTAAAALGLECAELLASEGTAAQSLTRAWRAAELFHESGEQQRASLLFESSGDELRSRRLLAESADAYERALRAQLNGGAALHLFAKLASVQHAASDFASTLATCERALGGSSRTAFADSSSRTHLRALAVDSLWKSGRNCRTELEELAATVQQVDLSVDACHFGSLVGLRLLLNDGHSRLEEQFLTAINVSTERHGPTLFGQLALLIYRAERGSTQDVLDLEHSLALAPTGALSPSSQCIALRYRSNALRWVGAFDGAIKHGHDAVARATDFGLLGEIDLTALQLSFMSMDRCDLATAADWLQKSQEAVKGVNIHERTRAHLHATARLRFQEGRFQECLEACNLSGIDPRKDLIGKRGAVISATLAAAAANTGAAEMATRHLQHCLGVIEREPPSLVLDYVAEMTARGLHALRRESEAQQLTDAYLLRRASRFDRPLAPFFGKLAKVHLD